MSSQWTNKYAIMRDLSMVQGCVPADIEGTVAAGEKPPAYNIVEETEEEFYRHYCTGDGDLAAPDVNLIAQMLDMVREIDVTSDPEESVEKPINIKRSPPKYVPVLSPFSYKKKDLSKSKSEPLTNLKCQREKKQTENTEKQTKTEQDSQSFVPLLSPFSFKKKEVCKKDSTASPPLQTTTTYMRQDIRQYVPSTQAKEYYQKYLERSQIREDFQEDIWTKAERKMKEIDERRKLEEELLLSQKAAAEQMSEATELTSHYGNQKLDVVRLPQHRHLLTGECIVCKVMSNTDNNVGAERYVPYDCFVDEGDLGISLLFDIDDNVDTKRYIHDCFDDEGDLGISLLFDMDDNVDTKRYIHDCFDDEGDLGISLLFDIDIDNNVDAKKYIPYNCFVDIFDVDDNLGISLLFG